VVKLTALWVETQGVSLVRINPSDDTVPSSSAIYTRTDRKGFSDLMISIYKASRRHTKIHYYYSYHHHHHQILRINNPYFPHMEDTMLVTPVSTHSNNTIDGFGGLMVSMLASGSRVRGFEPDRRRGSKIICPMSQLRGMSKIPVSAVNYELLAKFSSVSFPR
jgi:hypothetical protein